MNDLNISRQRLDLWHIVSFRKDLTLTFVSLRKDFLVKIYLFWLILMGKDLCSFVIIGKD